MANIDFPLILVCAVFLTGVAALAECVFLRKRRKKKVKHYRENTIEPDTHVISQLEKESVIIENARSIFPVLALVLIFRSFLFEPFQIPSGSMIPTLEIGDFILVNKFDYGVRLPVIGTKIISMGEPKRGDVMVFKEPMDPSINFIKRVIGLPGDHVSYYNKQLSINGKIVPSHFIAQLSDDDSANYELYSETLSGKNHEIRQEPALADIKEGTWVVPAGHYFVMGDNRDRSNDSRYWGFVPEQNIVGKAVYIWMHWPKWTDLPTLQHNGVIR